MELSPEGLARFFEVVWPVLDERQRRLVARALAAALGRGGTAWVTDASGMSRNTGDRRAARGGGRAADTGAGAGAGSGAASGRGAPARSD